MSVQDGYTHKFSTSKATTVFWLALLGQCLVFCSYNIVSNLASTLQGAKATTSLAILYVFYIISAFCFPVFIQLVRNQAPLLLLIGSMGYITLPPLSITGDAIALIIAGICVGCIGMFWSSHQLTISSLAIYISERQLLSEIQDGQHMDVKDGVDARHPIHHVSDKTNQSQVNWYLSTIVDKNNRLLTARLTPTQLEQFRTISGATLGLFSSLSWLSTQLASIVGSLIAFGCFNLVLGDDQPGVYTAETGSVKLFYGIMTAVNLLGTAAFFAAFRLSPKRVFYKINQKSKWDYYVAENQIGGGNGGDKTPSASSSTAPIVAPDAEPSSPSAISTQDVGDAVIITTVQNSDHPLPGRAKNDHLDDDGNFNKANPIAILTTCLRVCWGCASDPAILPLLIPFFTAYCPLSFTISAFSSKGGIKTILGVKFVPIFILIVAAADVITAFAIKNLLRTAPRARIACVLGLLLQLLGIVLMYVFPYFDHWHTKADAWMFGSIIGVIEGVGDGLAISGISTLVSILCRASPVVLSGVSSLLMCGRGLGLFVMFLLTSQTDFRDIHWPVLCAMIVAAILCHVVSFIADKQPNIAKITGQPEASALPAAAAEKKEPAPMPKASQEGQGGVEMESK